jgi:mono/diheme cytochrome c family protein
MSIKHKIFMAVLLGVILIESGYLGLSMARNYWKSETQDTPFLRGKRVAEKFGCFGCHGPMGMQGIINPGYQLERVPSWSGGTAMMFIHDESEIRQWILNGMPFWATNDVAFQERRSKALIKMPTYKNVISEEELADLIAFYKGIAWYETPESDDAAAGREIAFNHGCFGCHGPEGRGLNDNPLAFKGYIPSWDGSDYNELVQNDDEFTQWVKNGIADRFQKNPAAAHFSMEQIVQMPAFKHVLSNDEIFKIRAYVKWLRSRSKQPG